MNQKKIIVIGGGPAGMMAAIRAAELGGDVTLVEQNPSLGRKLLLTGKGRCNLTNDCPLEEFLKRYFGNGAFLRDSFKQFFNTELKDYFRARGLDVKVERQKRVFPVTDRASSVLNTLKNDLKRNGVRLVLGQKVSNFIVKDESIVAVCLEGGQKTGADALILATGGKSYPRTGSDGKMLDLLSKKGHKIVPLRPGLVGLIVKEKYPSQLEGLVLKNIALRFHCGKRRIISDVGEVLFTRNGISGPLVVSLSGQIIDFLAEGKTVQVDIDMKPALSEDQVDSRLRREFDQFSKKTIKGILKKMLPLRFVDVFLASLSLDPQKVSSQISKEERRLIVAGFKGFSMEIVRARDFDDAMVTRGGVSLKEIDPKTMRSRLFKNLYFAGELIDIDGDTGGFNLQAAFSTGYLAGQTGFHK